MLTKWYALLAFLGTMLTAVFAVEAAFPPQEAGGNYIQSVFLVICIITATWSFWCCPLIDAGDLRPDWDYEPRRRLRSLRATIWAPTVLTVIILLIYVGALIYSHLDNEPEIDYPLTLWRVAVMLGTLAVISIFTIFLGKVVRARIKRASAIRRICFQCGYDLRGNASASQCPECGRPIEWR